MVATLLKWIAYMPALDKRASEEHRKWARRTETELQIYDCDHLCDKGECVENLLSAADAFTPMKPRQSSPAHAVVMRSMLLVLGAVLRSPGASVHAVRSKHAQRCLERLAQLTSIEDLGAAEVLLSFIKLLDEAGRVYAQRALVPIVGERSSLGRLLATGAPAVEPNTDQRVLLAFDTLGRSAVSLGIVREDSYPGFFLSCQRQLGCYLDAGARDTAALKWLAEFVVTPGQKVILRGLETEELNGRKGVVTGPAKAGEGGWRVPVQAGLATLESSEGHRRQEHPLGTISRYSCDDAHVEPVIVSAWGRYWRLPKDSILPNGRHAPETLCFVVAHELLVHENFDRMRPERPCN